MDDNTIINKLISDARLIIRNHHDGLGDNMIKEAGDVRKGVLKWAGFRGGALTDKMWTAYIPMMPKEIQGVMIELDDALDVHDTTRYV